MHLTINLCSWTYTSSNLTRSSPATQVSIYQVLFDFIPIFYWLLLAMTLFHLILPSLITEGIYGYRSSNRRQRPSTVRCYMLSHFIMFNYMADLSLYLHDKCWRNLSVRKCERIKSSCPRWKVLWDYSKSFLKGDIHNTKVKVKCDVLQVDKNQNKTEHPPLECIHESL